MLRQGYQTQTLGAQNILVDSSVIFVLRFKYFCRKATTPSEFPITEEALSIQMLSNFSKPKFLSQYTFKFLLKYLHA